MKDTLRFTFCILFICIIAGGLAGCGDDEAEPAPDASEFVSEGWEEYIAGNYEDAIAKFQKALAEDPAKAEAYNGIGWAKARLGQVRDSIDSFNNAVSKEPGNADAHAGLAGMYFADGDYERAIASANMALSLGTDYTSHHDDMKAFDIRILLAQCYYNIGNYDAARAQIDLLGGAGRTLDPSSPSYPVDLLSLIEELAEEGI